MNDKRPKRDLAEPVVVVRRRGSIAGIDPRTVAREARRILVALGEHETELSVLLVTDDLMREMNRQWRGIDAPTDVLSFPQREPESAAMPAADVLGDVVISVETAARQAAWHSSSLQKEVSRLLIHGVLHLVGHDHRTDEEEASMEARGGELLACLKRG